MSGNPTRIAVQSERRLVRDALCTFLGNRPEFLIVGQTARVESLYRVCALRHPDLAVVDTERLTVDLVDAVRGISEKFPHTRLVIAYGSLDQHSLAAADRAGITALVPSERGLAGLMFELRRNTGPARPAVHNGLTLTARELEIVSLLGSGRSVPEIAEWLRISPHTVENHKRRVYVKLGVGNQIHAVSRAASLGLIPSEGSVRAQRRDMEPGRGALAVVTGANVPCVDEVTRVLIQNQVPVVRAGHTRLTGRDHWAQWHRGPIVGVLIDPGADDWMLTGALGAQTVLVCAAEPDLTEVVDALLRGVRAVVRAADVRTDLVGVLNLVAHGYFAMPAGHLDELVDWLGVRMGEGAGVPELTGRERDILASIGRGETVRQTARSLGIAAKTVENTQARLFRKLGVHNRSGALTIAHQLGLIDPAVAG